MTHSAGAVPAGEPDAAALTATERASLGADVIRVLAALHAIDPDAVGLGDLGPRDGYLSRQQRRCVRNWEAWGVGSPAGPVWQECRRRLDQRIPGQQRVVIAHGDFRLSNLLVEHGRVAAVLDWELCALGDPLADLAWLIDDWRSPRDPAIAMPSPIRVGGFADRDTLLADYGARTGLDLAPLPYYRAFTHWKAATLLQGVLLRRRSGGLGEHGAVDPLALEQTITFLLREALDLLGPPAERIHA